jgi:hypothetical protein
MPACVGQCSQLTLHKRRLREQHHVGVSTDQKNLVVEILQMKQSYDPWLICKSGPVTKEELQSLSEQTNDGTRWVFEAIQVVVGLAYAYETFSGGSGGTSQLLSDIYDTLDDLRDKVDKLNRNLNAVIDRLDRLPLIVRGEIENAMIRQSIGKADQIVSIIQDSLREEFIEVNLPNTKNLIQQLQIEIGGIFGLRGVAGSIVAAPYLTVWLSANVAVEKFLLSKNKNYKVDSPWKKGFMKQNSKMFIDLFDQAEKTDANYQGFVIPKTIPPHKENLAIDSSGYLSPAKNGNYLISCPFGLSDSENLETKNPLWPTDTWKPVSSSDTAHATAYAEWTRVKERRTEILAFYDIVPKLHLEKARIIQSFVEPVGFWV